MSKDRHKVHEFVAHANDVTCITIGSVSNQVLATGGEDRKVNVWRVGKSSNIMSLSGSNTPITCLCFDNQETGLVSGSQGGSLKLYDLNESKLARSLKGHMTSVTCVDYHPHADVVVSGSEDTNMKVWDVRNKTCIQTYKGHSAKVTCVRFSPDGQWVGSSANDGAVKLWDVTAGKIVQTFRAGSTNVPGFTFNPTEFLLAAITSDRIVKFWDLETFELIGSTVPDTQQIKTVAFTGDGDSLLTATQEGLKEHRFDPIATARYMPMPWQQVELNTMLVTKTGSQLLAGSFVSNFASIWAVELDLMMEYRAGEEEYDPQRAIRNREMKQQAKARQQSEQMEACLRDAAVAKEDQLSVMGHGVVQAPVPKANKVVQQRRVDSAPNRRQSEGRSQVPDLSNNARVVPKGSPCEARPSARCVSAGRRRERSGTDDRSLVEAEAQACSERIAPKQVKAVSRVPVEPHPPENIPMRSMSAGQLRDNGLLSNQPPEIPNRPSSNSGITSTPLSARPISRSALKSIGQNIVSESPLRPLLEQRQVDYSASGLHQQVPPRDYPQNINSNPVLREASPYNDELEVLANSCDYNFQGEKPVPQNIGIDREAERRAFERDQALEQERERERRARAAEIRRHGPSPSPSPLYEKEQGGNISNRGMNQATDPPRSAERFQNALSTDDTIIAELLMHRSTVTLSLNSRLSQIQNLKSRWLGGDWEGVLTLLEQLSSPGVGGDQSSYTTICDFFKAVDLHFEAMSLDSCVKLLPLLLRILSLGMEAQVLVALKTSTVLIDMFGQYVCETRYAPRQGAVDISKEERIRKCDICYSSMIKLRQEVFKIRQQAAKYDRGWEIEEYCDKLESFFQTNVLD